MRRFSLLQPSAMRDVARLLPSTVPAMPAFNVHIAQTRRIFSLRFTQSGLRGRVTLPIGGVRWYSSQQQGGSGQPASYGQYPPPGHHAGPGGAPMYPPPGAYPPPPMYAQYPPPPMYFASAPAPEIGTKERPLVVAPLPQPPSWASRLWLLLLVIIGISAFINVFEEIGARMGYDASAGTPGAAGGGAAGNRLSAIFGVNAVKPVDLDASQVSFEDIQGIDEAKEELREIVLFLKDPKRFAEVGARLPKGALLVGPPGCGKTMLAKAIAKESGVSFFYANGSEFDEMFVGVGSRRVRELFAAAKEHAPALIFIDEIDSLAGKRSSKDQSHSRMTLNQLLAEMDGFQSSDEVIVLAATNTPDVLDKALTRPGRFDTTIAVDPPDMKGRAAIVETYLKKIKKDVAVTAMDIARGTTGFTGAELSNLINVAAIRSVTHGKGVVTLEEVDYAKDRVMMGSENRSKKIPEEERRITAYHEGGHALVALLLEKEGADPVHKATIIPRGSGIMGLVQQQPKEDKYSSTKRGMLTRLKVCLAGRIAEEIILGDADVTTGASSDFQQATNMARNMVRRFGFSTGLGTVDYQSAETSEGAFMSDSTKQKIEQEVQTLVDTAFTEAKTLLLGHREALDNIAHRLLEYDTLSGDQLKAIVEGRPVPDRFHPAAVRQVDVPPPSPPGGSAIASIQVVAKPRGGVEPLPVGK